MEKFDCKQLIKGSLYYFKKLNITNNHWSDVMKNEDIPLELRNLLNGVRYIYSDEVNYKITHCCLDKDFVTVFPTGSNDLHSDIDTQIAIEINHKVKLNDLNKMIRFIIKILNDSKKLWNIESVEKSLDINYYPPTLFNISMKKIDSHYILLGKTNNSDKYQTVWIPQLKDKENYKLFFDAEMEKLKDYETKYNYTNTNKYYKLYTNNKIKCLGNLILKKDYYEKNNKEHDKEINDNILCLTEYKHIGPEMHFTYSSILFVVWFLQLGHKVSKRLLRKIAPIVVKEQNELYKITKKEKYKERMLVANKYV